jgi:hypothetical protein
VLLVFSFLNFIQSQKAEQLSDWITGFFRIFCIILFTEGLQIYSISISHFFSLYFLSDSWNCIFLILIKVREFWNWNCF